MANTIPKQIAAKLATRLGTIKVVNGYNTNAGNSIVRGRRSFGETDLSSNPAISVWINDATAGQGNRDRMEVAIGIIIEGFFIIDTDNPDDDAEDLLGDIRKALLLSTDQYVYDSVSSKNLVSSFFPTGWVKELPEDGSKIGSVQLRIDAVYPETYGDPYAIL